MENDGFVVHDDFLNFFVFLFFFGRIEPIYCCDQSGKE